MAAIEEEESKKEGDEEEGEGLTPKEPLKGVQKKEPKNTKTIDIHWNYQSSFTSIKLIIVIMLISELITSLGLVIFCFTNPGDPMLDITMGSFVIITIIFLIAIYPEDNSWTYVIHGNKISLTFLVALRAATSFISFLILIKTMMSVMACIWFVFQTVYLALTITLICYPRTQIGNLVLKS